ncbi:hypothetical protein [Streptomyces sp. NPDC088726]|uniref:hypothetical protein n=1 Tax=Streptomyces sp. NPDC088726 TaxID=3365874 RepID=UPI00381B2A9E
MVRYDRGDIACQRADVAARPLAEGFDEALRKGAVDVGQEVFGHCDVAFQGLGCGRSRTVVRRSVSVVGDDRGPAPELVSTDLLRT